MLRSLSLILLAGAMNGSFATPMKRVRGWEWEHIWLVWSFLGMVVIPWAVAVATVPALHAVYRLAGTGPLLRTAIYGLGWGAGAVLFGLGIVRIGLALGFAIILGTASSLGAVVPLVMLHADRIFTTAGLLTFAGVGIIVIGLAASARAGVLREAATRKRGDGRAFMIGLIICTLSGLGSTLTSVALNQATPIFSAAETMGAAPDRSLNAVWPVLLGGGFVVNSAYCIFLLVRKSNAARFYDAAGYNFGLVVTMAMLWSGSNFVYGTGAHGMGPLGLVLGWPVFMAAIVLTANTWGLVTGEWHDAQNHATTWAAYGIVLLIFGIVVIAQAGSRS